MKTEKSERALVPVEPQRDGRGRFTNGTAPGPGRPPGLINLVTRSLREEILSGFAKKGGVEGFVADLMTESPPSAAALLCKLLPPEATEEAEGASKIESVEIITVPRGHYVLPEDLGVSSFLYTEAEVAEIQAVQDRARERADSLRRTFMETDPPPDDAPPNGL